MSKPSPSFPARVFSVLASFGLATIVLSFLLLITLLGTLSQKDIGLLDSQRLYFDSFYVFHDFHIGDLAIPTVLPGGMLLMIILFINMLCGAVIRIRKGLRTAGALIAHVSIMFMLVAGFVSYHYKTEGAMPLFEGQTSDQYQSYHDRVIEVRRFDSAGKGEMKALTIPMEHFTDLEPGKARTFHAKDLPFELIVTGYQRNARVVKSEEGGSDVLDGYKLQPLTVAKEDEANLSAIFATAKFKDGAEQKSILWEGVSEPFTVKAGDVAYTIGLSRMKWKLPFAIRLKDFQRELHPGTMKPKKYTSHIVEIVNGKEKEQVITMNVPLRDQNYVVYQASFSESANGEQSVFTIASNPSDQWPLWSCVAVAFGLCVQFILQLVRFLSRALKPKPAVQP
jgi:hypothetical protein